ncbi:transcriptional regulator domain-containing protein [Novosphingobium resinovorum]|jgi:hypothetical protein|uniref:transcriptional regulator domain-containing protein n=1 Tax=Novosphingobium resinovorum TaxID=158500 RepID=UPI0009DCB942
MPRKLDPERCALDFAGFAQEFLRRNPVYRSQYAAVTRGSEGRRTGTAQEVMARFWGLSFPLCAGPIASS